MRELRLDPHRFGDPERRLDFAEQFDLLGGGAQTLAARSVGVRCAIRLR